MNAHGSREPNSSALTSLAPTGTTRLAGKWLLAGRVTWLGLFAVTLIAFALSLPGAHADLMHPTPENAVLSPGAAKALASAGISVEVYAWISVAVAAGAALVAAAIALLLFWRRGNDWMVLLSGLFMVIYMTSNSAGTANNAPTSNPDVTLATGLLIAQSMLWWAVIFGVFLLFPSGRFVPRWSWVLLASSAVWSGAIVAWPTWLDGILYLGYPLFLGGAIACMAYRYRRALTPVQRQQTKWAVAGIIATLIANQVFGIPSGFTPLGQSLYAPLANLVFQVSVLLVPVTFFIAIQRYRLYDIDAIINRALVYGSLTVILAALYLALVLGTQSALHALTGQRGDEPVIIVASTLLIAALFNPLRKRLQATIDRRFYRRKYDAAKTVERFGASLRSQLELSALSDQLVMVVRETIQPAHVSLWLRADQHSGAGSSGGQGRQVVKGGRR